MRSVSTFRKKGAKEKIIDIIIAADVYDYVVWDNRGADYIPGKSHIRLTLNPGVYIRASTNQKLALDLGYGWTAGDTFEFILKGPVITRNGDGGYCPNPGTEIIIPPTAGGTAMNLRNEHVIIDVSEGWILGGGGGGGSTVDNESFGISGGGGGGAGGGKGGIGQFDGNPSWATGGGDGGTVVSLGPGEGGYADEDAFARQGVTLPFSSAPGRDGVIGGYESEGGFGGGYGAAGGAGVASGPLSRVSGAPGGKAIDLDFSGSIEWVGPHDNVYGAVSPTGVLLLDQAVAGGGSVAVPTNIIKIGVTLIGGGAGGGSMTRATSDDFFGGGGGGSGGLSQHILTVIPGETLDWTVGAGGAGAYANNAIFFGVAGGTGGATTLSGSFGTVTVPGGQGGQPSNQCGGAGGCGGVGGTPSGVNGQNAPFVYGGRGGFGGALGEPWNANGKGGIGGSPNPGWLYSNPAQSGAAGRLVIIAYAV